MSFYTTGQCGILHARMPSLHALIISPYLYLVSFPEHNPETIRNISILLGGLIKQVNAECLMQE